ncbi:hypothetical protein [Leeia sp.]|uniref:hypothetical protein n=1 Tax=Leeia sp. TaxID=2884678 RepID=UPI0035AEADFB
MSTTACRECNLQISPNVANCPGCGAAVRQPGNTGCSLLFIALVIFGWVMWLSRSNAPAPDRNTASTAPATAVVEAPPNVASLQSVPVPDSAATPPSPWEYSANPDPLRKAQTREASLRSSDLDAKLTVRQSPKYGFDIYLSIRQGRFQCSMGGSCTLHARFDDQPEKSWRVTASNDDDTRTVFLAEGSNRKFLALLKKSRQLVIEVGLYQQGDQQFIFDNTAGLEWD